jgi:hypothetical protein
MITAALHAPQEGPKKEHDASTAAKLSKAHAFVTNARMRKCPCALADATAQMTPLQQLPAFRQQRHSSQCHSQARLIHPPATQPDTTLCSNKT